MLSRVRLQVQDGGVIDKDGDFQPYSRRKDELSTQDGCLLWGSRVVVPKFGRTKILDILHIGHPGVSRMKALARSFVWWPGLDSDLEERVKKCDACQLNQKTPSLAPLHPWDWPSRPWSRVHIDHAGPFLGKTFLIVVDAHSKWLDVKVVPSTNSSATILALRQIFSNLGIPEVIVSDNGTAFTSTEFPTFVQNNGIRHVRSSPYHPASNGLAERAVQTFKESKR